MLEGGFRGGVLLEHPTLDLSTCHGKQGKYGTLVS